MKRWMCLIVVVALGGGEASGAVKGKIREVDVLFIGNSYTYGNNLPAVLRRFAQAARPRVRMELGRSLKGGYTLEKQFDEGIYLKEIEVHRKKVRRTEFEYGLLQEQSQMPFLGPGRMHMYARKIAGQLKGKGVKVAFFMTWARQHQPEKMKLIAEAYTKIGKELGAPVAPVGLAWEAAMKANGKLVLHTKDKSHPNQLGTYLAACVIYQTLVGGDVRKLMTNGGLKQVNLKRAKFLQKIAYETVTAYQKAYPLKKKEGVKDEK